MNPAIRVHAKYRGITLVEVCIIIVVLLILAGMLLPVLSKDHTKSRRVNCEGNLKQIGLAALMYSGDYAGFFMNVNPRNYGHDQHPRTGNWQPLGVIQYVADTDSKVWSCPSITQDRSDCDSSNYQYIGSGLKDDNELAVAVAMGFDASGNHPENQWMNALFLDGHVEGAKPNGKLGWNNNSPRPVWPAAPPAVKKSR